MKLIRTHTQNDHKAIHKTAQGKSANGILDNLITPKVVSKPDPATGLFNPFPTFNYTGALRPVYPLSPMRKVPKSIPRPDYAGTGIPKSERFLNRNKFDILDQKGQNAMRKVCRLGREVLDIVAAEVKPGVTTDYLDEVCHKATIERNVGAHQPLLYRTHIPDRGRLTFTVLPVSAELQPLP